MATTLQIEYARSLAEKSILEMATGYGCVLIYNGKIVSEGNNQRKGMRSSKTHQCLLCA